ncbi:hypothetical protein BN159_7442 [Streptomyces davaonensis JCM 4913]|uniref:Uncharacterized protein n=1 Tax=Streptomyces davaonensis (strain DSM 101723 / JCM 4913 / KCC S-0913 / 768) TaxID=1214101 RepID=K4R6G5_STRDJ|nr:hypothetical protein [Streptomyces davaonensis]CCK31821.1 hypothetical protein BN159_7442 [Streptomyces davaonensis JCM 4913]
MSRYDWPAARPGGGRGARRGRAEERRRHNSSFTTGSGDITAVETAPSVPVVMQEPRETLLRRLRKWFARAAPPPGGPNADRDLWLPVGPSGTLRGQADSDPRVAGRVRDLRISPDGQRAYAASAAGGLWYTDTAGARWEAVGAWASVAARAELAAASHSLTCGAVYVRFDAGGDPAGDEVWLLTGEPGSRGVTPVESGTGGAYGGVGVLFARGPVHTSRTTPLIDPWTRQAQPRLAAGGVPAYPGLRGAGAYTVAADPADDRHLVAATTRGLHEKSAAGAGDPWSLVTVAAWEALAAGTSARVSVCDVAWTPATGAHPARLWVAVANSGVAGLDGLWLSTAGPAGPFAQVALPGLGAHRRLGLAADPAFPDVLYVLGSGPVMWRVDNAIATPVAPLPAGLFQPPGGNDQSGYDLALAVDPANASRVVVGGSTAASPHDGSWSASLYRLTLAGGPPGGYVTDYVAGDAADARWIGAEVHADVHRVRWQTVGGAAHVWVCCDGGVFRSTAAGAPGTFASRSTGLAVTEVGFLALHPLSDGPVLAGVQDNGAQLRVGESVWRRALGQGDAGGVAFDPGTPGRFVAQYANSEWFEDGDTEVTPSRRGAAAAFGLENSRSRFYSNPAVLRRADGVTQLAVGTNRVWYSERWGRSWQSGAIWKRLWDTLPADPGVPSPPVDPRAGDANDAVTNTFTALSGPLPLGALAWPNGIHALRWGGEDRLYVLQRGAVHRLDRNPALVGPWTLTTIMTRPAPPVVAPAALPWPLAAATLPFAGALNDFAVHDPAAGPHGSLYVATSHPLEPLWWFDGNATWHPCRLGTLVPPAPPLPAVVPLPPDGVRAPAYAVVVDPANPSIVYVGTAVGVWRGVLTLPGPTWVWTPYVSGLPEAAVQDLVIGSWPRPGGGSLTLLRAALQARGVWEVEPGVDAAPTTYLRVHPYDSRRITPTDPRDPLWHLPRPERDWPLDWGDRRNRDFRTGAGTPAPAPDGTPVGSYPWHASPDIRLRPARAATAVPAGPAGLPWTTPPANRFWLWSLQTALRAVDPLIVPDGRWTAWWRSRLRGVRVTLGLDPAPGQTRVDNALWNHPQVQAAFWTDPWAAAEPTEHDLIERVVGQPTPRVGPPTAKATSPASAAALRRPYRVDVCLHHRGREEVRAATAAVTLLRLPLPAAPAAWAGLAPPAFPAGPALTALRGALDALPAAGGALPGGLPLAGGWTVADAAVGVRRPTRSVVTGAPAVVGFDVDFSAAAPGSRWLLLALAHSTADPLTPVGADLRALALGSRHAAARSVQVV